MRGTYIKVEMFHRGGKPEVTKTPIEIISETLRSYKVKMPDGTYKTVRKTSVVIKEE